MVGSSGASRTSSRIWWPVQPKLGIVVGKFAPPHKGHQLVIDTALEHCDQVIVLVYGNPDFPDMPVFARADWLRFAYRGTVNLEVFVPENAPPNDADDWTQREFVRVWLEERGLEPNMVFGSEEYIAGFASHIKAIPFVVDLERLRVPTSGTEVRKIWQAYRESVIFVNDPPLFYTTHGDLELFAALEHRVSYPVLEASQHWREPAHRIVLMGAESTGKSTLTERLAQEFNEPFVLEYGREVWQTKNGQLEQSDYTHIAEHHRELEDVAILKANRFLFVDTNAITTAYLGSVYEGTVPDRVIELAKEAETRYHHVFLLDDDIPFEQDGWRDGTRWRSRSQSIIKYDLRSRGVHFTPITGDLETRVNQVRAVLDGHVLPVRTQ
jgi:HTH-type transcriptional regulator, transcriptional repressor of NAD biosynthesis genes